MVCRPGLCSCTHAYRPMEDSLVPARTVRIDASEEGREALRRRLGGLGRSQRLEQGVGALDVVLNRVQPRQILVRESVPLASGPHERSGGAHPGSVRKLTIEPVDAVMLHQPQPCRLHGILPSKPRFSALSFRLQSALLCCGGLLLKTIEDSTQPIFNGPSHPVGGQLCRP